ncbi:MAG: HAD family hydrolase [Candidatus Eremiobacteraeota bacterium]|nr:HAD family hydrolase [Candidatus Eremiobacteraeota bacterium]
MHSNYLIAFDFDGVIWNSVDECFHLGYRVFKEMEGKIPADDSILMEKFRHGRYLAKTGDDFYILFRMMKQDPSIDFNETTFDQFFSCRERYSEKINDFSKGFYNERWRTQEKDIETWLSLQGPYPDVMEQLPGLKDEFLDVAICSAKDESTINLLIARYNQSYCVYGREHSKYKPDLIRAIAREMQIESSKIIFIDDLMENLRHVKSTDCICIMADWGYNNKRERNKAKNEGFPVISRKNIMGQLIEIIEKRGDYDE